VRRLSRRGDEHLDAVSLLTSFLDAYCVGRVKLDGALPGPSRVGRRMTAAVEARVFRAKD
jgi:hypothetical protein